MSCVHAPAVLRDCWYGQFDPANVGTGAWLYILSSATNQLGGNVPGVTNVDSMFAYIKSQGMQHVIVKAGTSNMLWTGSGNVSTNNTAAAQFSPSLVQKAHNAGLLIFGSNRSWGSDLDGENNVAKYVFSVGADGFIWDAEAEWEAGRPGITNGPAQAWYMCSQLRTAFPTKFLAHNPFDTLYLHSSFPYKEFGYWADVVIPQVYHHAASKGNASAAINWTDVNYNTFYASLVGTSSVINGQTIYWTNSIKPVWYMREIYNGGAGTTPTPPNDITEFVDYMMADVNCPSPVPFQAANWFRVELYSPTQWTKVKESTLGIYSNVVNNICIDEASANFVGSWTPVTTITCTTGSVITFSGETGTDTNAFGISYRKKTAGTGTAYAEYSPKVLAAGDYNVFQWHPFRADASVGVPLVVNSATGAQTVYADQTTNGGIWSFVGRFPFASGTTTIRMADATLDGNAPMADGIKLMFVYPTSVPLTPANLTATAAGISQINLTWADAATNEAGYIVARSFAPGGPFVDIATLPINSSAFNDTNLSENTVYYYMVRATNYLGASASSSQTSATTFSSVPVAPSLVVQPQSRNAIKGQNVILNVFAGGTAPLRYQWNFNGNPLDGATESSLTLANISIPQGGAYSVSVSNDVGGVLSSNAVVVVNPAFRAAGWTKLWALGGGSRPYLTGTNNTERGLAYNANRNHVLVMSRSIGTQIFVLDGDTGADVSSMNVDSATVTGGTYPLLMIGAADDGAVYAGNLTTAGATTPFRLYRWASDDVSAAPVVAFSGDPAPTDNQRWGDTLIVRGFGTNTQVLIGSRTGRSVVLFTTTNGTSFAPTWINTAAAATGNFGLGIAFGVDDSFWGKAKGLSLLGVSYSGTTGTIATNFTGIPSTVSPIGVSVEMNLLAGIGIDAPDNLQLYDLAPTNGAPLLIGQTNFATANTNSFAVGAVDFGDDRVYALDSNNGILAMKINAVPTPVACESVVQLVDGRVQINGSGNPGTTNLVQRSTNLIDWTTLASFLNVNGTWHFVDADATNQPRAFYRASQ